MQIKSYMHTSIMMNILMLHLYQRTGKGMHCTEGHTIILIIRSKDHRIQTFR